MGTAQLQGELWSADARSWATLQERTLGPAFEVVLTKVNAGPGLSLLDIGCGSGMGARLGGLRGMGGGGVGASPASLESARERTPGGAFSLWAKVRAAHAGGAFVFVTGFKCLA